MLIRYFTFFYIIALRFLPSQASAQAGFSLSLDRVGGVTWTQPYVSASLTIESSTSFTAPWLPVTNIVTMAAAGSATVKLTNNPVFVRAVGGDTSGAPAGMALVPEGSFKMGDTYSEGSSDERPTHDVFISAFWIDRFEVTNQKVRDVFQWAWTHNLIFSSDLRVVKDRAATNALLDLHRDEYTTDSTRYWSGLVLTNGVFGLVPGRENQPCIDISWFGAAAFCNFISMMEGLDPCFNPTNGYSCDFTKNGYRLPTEAEWEKAARGGRTGHHFPWESYGGGYATFINTNYANYTPPTLPHPFHMQIVGYYNGSQNPPGPDMVNGYGLYDMAGNAREWCYDWYSAIWYMEAESSLPNTTGPSGGSLRVTRGGSFDLGPFSLRASCRNNQAPSAPTAASWYNGFRRVRKVQ